ncbi:hypothetical protein [Noviherbaspirillum suwonense]|uniref:DUF4143 domain-containing protein n=1 Tax=Noviherbaspirillum suwonense TaxID=1224511 RepID=A0ABY1QUE6_9BURK|nr:hypothetical protein [Noviherbaspirillum suwonense]SMP80749.1 hypothetical protein SAMN06295970_13818 [Noviherbaspirillum suwonense]
MSIPQWDSITREERHFTAILFAELRRDARPLWNILRGKFGLDESVTVVDVGFEVCMFRDLIHAGLIERSTDVMRRRKQTFDFVLTLSNQSLVLIEAKAHECFGLDQLDRMEKAKGILLNRPELGIHNVYLAGLCSSDYNPQNVKKGYEDFKLFYWADLTGLYPQISNYLTRADGIYNS